MFLWVGGHRCHPAHLKERVLRPVDVALRHTLLALIEGLVNTPRHVILYVTGYWRLWISSILRDRRHVVIMIVRHRLMHGKVMFRKWLLRWHVRIHVIKLCLLPHASLLLAAR